MTVIKNIRNGGKVADIIMYGVVGDEIKGTEVANHINFLSQSGVDTIHEWINSPGGSVLDGYSIIAENIKSNAEIHTHNVGVAASMGGMILMTGDVRHSYDYAKMMVHEPTISGKKIDEMQDGNDKNGLIALRDGLATIIKNRTGKNKNEIKKMFDMGDVWISAEEAKAQGFIDKIDKTEKKPDINSIQDIVNLCDTYHDSLNISEIKNHKKMELICNHFGLNEASKEVDVLNKIKDIELKSKNVSSELATKTKELAEQVQKSKDLQDKVTAFEAKEKELNKQLLSDAVENAIKEGKIDEKKKDEMIAKFEGNMGGFKAVIEAMPTATVLKIINQINDNNIVTGEPDKNTFAWLEKNNPKELERIKNQEPARFEKMLKDENINSVNI